MNYLKDTLSRTNNHLQRQTPVVQIFAGLAAGTICGSIIVHLGKSVLYALGLTLLFFELTTETSADDHNQLQWNSAGVTLDIQPYVKELKQLFVSSQTMAIGMVSGCLIGISVGAA